MLVCVTGIKCKQQTEQREQLQEDLQVSLHDVCDVRVD